MSFSEDSIDSLKSKLKSVTKLKLSKERDVLKLRTKERILTDELNLMKAEVECLTEQLESLKNKITQSTHQVSMIDICSSSEDVKIEAHINTLNKHLEGFESLYAREKQEHEKRCKEQRDKIAELQAKERHKQKEMAEANEASEREAATIEQECKIIEQECAVLKKRNNAIMLKLRKQLLEADNTRRELMKQNCPETKTSKET